MSKRKRAEKALQVKPTKHQKAPVLLRVLSVSIAPAVIATSFAANVNNGAYAGNVPFEESGQIHEQNAVEKMPQHAKPVRTPDEAKQLKAQLSGSNSAIIYDPWGRLAKIVEPDSSVRQFLYSGDRLCEERDGSSAVTKQFFNWGEIIGGTKYFYTRDHLGSVTEMTDQSGNIVAQYKYDSWGNVTKIAGSGPDSDFLYAGYFYHKPSGLYITAHRLYSPKLGRWLNRDPIDDPAFAMVPQNPELDAAPENESASGAPINANFMTFLMNGPRPLAVSQVPNPYTYAANNPISKVDPSGLKVEDMGPTPCPQPGCRNDCDAHPANCHLGRRWSQQQQQYLYVIYFQQPGTPSKPGKTCTTYGYDGWNPFNQNQGHCDWLCN